MPCRDEIMQFAQGFHSSLV